LCTALLSSPHVASVAVAATPTACTFIRGPNHLLPPEIAFYATDTTERATWSQLGDPVLHVRLRNWADAAVIAPLSANTLGKLSNGLCDNLVTCVARAWPVKMKPFVVAPAMNTAMWKHPISEVQLEVLRREEFGCTVVEPVPKMLACGDYGVGGMASAKEIVRTVLQELQVNSI
jgi:phosphopantothenoylcysteine decarboxylase